MNAEEIRDYVLQKINITEGFPFGDSTLVFKINGKIFLLMSLDKPACSINVKCDPLKAIELRELFPDIILPGYHMNKKHWNTVITDKIKNDLLLEMIDESYNLVSKKKS